MAHGQRWLVGTGLVLALAAALALISGGAPASLAVDDIIIYVDADADPGGGGSSWTDAYNDLQLALEDAEAEAPVQIWVATGTYTPTWQFDTEDPRSATFQLVNGVAIYGGFAGNEALLNERDWVNNVTILSGDIGTEDDDSDNVYHVLRGIEINEPVVLDGLTITGGYAKTTASYDERFGGGLFAYAAELRLENLRVEGNTAEEWGGGLYINGSNATLVNVTFSGNAAGNGGGFCVNNSEAALTNCTFSGNSATAGGAIYVYNASPSLINCILWGDDGPEILNAGTSAPAVTYSDIQGSYEGEENIDADPLFVDAAGGDLRLQLASPAIDAGDSSAPGLVGIHTDLGGNPRFAGVVDMGAYEAPHNPLFVDLDAIGANDGTSWEDALTDLQVALAWAQDGVEIWAAAGTYKPTWRFDAGDPRSAAFQMANGVAIYGGFDPSVGADEWEERDWEANSTILSGDLNGDDGPDFANREDNSYHVFYHDENPGSSAILDGFTISGGNASGPPPHRRGGGMYSYKSSPTLTNCTFEDNSASLDAGGMLNWVDSSPTLTNCTFKGNLSSQSGGGMQNIASAPTLTDLVFINNSARYGGGLYNHYSSPVLTNVAFIGNEAEYGGGMHAYNSAEMLTNCTFSGNSATYYGGGLYNDYSTPTLTNCILWGDTTGGLPSEISGDPATVTYSDIQGGYPDAGGTNIDADPLFLDPDNGDVHLGPGSPCIDAGTDDVPDPPGLPETDFEGDPRIMDGDDDGEPIVDMGVDEALWHPVYLPLVLKNY